MAKLKLIQGEDGIYVHNAESGENVIKFDENYPELQVEFECHNGLFSGTKLLDLNGDTKLILEYQNASWSEEKTKAFWDLWSKGEFPYKKGSNGELVNVVPTEDIVECSNTLNVYTADGHRIFEVTRGEIWDYNIQDFGIRFNEDSLVLCVSRGIYNSMETDTTTYSYSGKVLSEKHRKVDAKSLIKEEINKACKQSSSQSDAQPSIQSKDF